MKLTLAASLLAAGLMAACGGGGDSGSATTTTSGGAGSASGLTASVLCGISSSVFNSSTSDNATSTASWSCGGSSCTLIGNTGSGSIEALSQTSFKFGTDDNRAHVQPGGVYHHHGMPELYLAKLGKGTAMTQVGWAADGFPIYVRYGSTTASNATSAIKVLKASWRTKATPNANRPATTLYAMGTFAQDWEYAAGSGDLDECNGRTG